MHIHEMQGIKKPPQSNIYINTFFGSKNADKF